jgi:hypothetical protein
MKKLLLILSFIGNQLLNALYSGFAGTETRDETTRTNIQTTNQNSK